MIKLQRQGEKQGVHLGSQVNNPGGGWWLGWGGMGQPEDGRQQQLDLGYAVKAERAEPGDVLEDVNEGE